MEACRLAMSEVRVRLPLGALSSVWESLEIRLPWAQEIVSSNLTTLAALRCGRMVRRLPVKETSTGSIPVTAALWKGQPDHRSSRRCPRYWFDSNPRNSMEVIRPDEDTFQLVIGNGHSGRSVPAPRRMGA